MFRERVKSLRTALKDGSSKYIAATYVAALLGACGGSNGSLDPAPAPITPPAATNVLYVQSNNIAAGQNSVLAYSRAADGTLTPLAGSPVLTGGTGLNNPTAGRVGPNDLDYPLIATPDKRRLFATNSGSHTIAVFDINSDGSLRALPRSPFLSEGFNPVSLAIARSQLFVVNKTDEFPPQLGPSPNYTALNIGSDGSLTSKPLGGIFHQTTEWSSPSQIIASRDGNVLFGSDFLGPSGAPGADTLHSRFFDASGFLTPSGRYSLPPGPVPPLPLALGLFVHPTQNILYVAFVRRNQVGVYTFDRVTGVLTFVRAVTNSGREVSRILTSANGTRLYTVNNIDNSISFYDNSDPLQPVERQKLNLKEPGPLFLNDRGADSFMQPTSTPYQFALSPDERFLYVVNQRSNATNPAVTEGNKIHILTVAADGTLSEPAATVNLPVPPSSRPQGVVVF